MRNFIVKCALGLAGGRFYKTASNCYVSKLARISISNHSSRQVYHHSSGVISDFSLDNPAVKKYVERLVAEYETLIESSTKDVDFSRLSELKPLIEMCKARHELCANLLSLKELSESEDKDLASLAEEESQLFKEKLGILESELLELLIPRDHQDASREVVMEISAGVGGQEAMLFAKELHEMYLAYADFKGWSVEVAEMALSEIGGLRHSSVFISGDEVFKYLKHEAGVHRVQRIPSTERSGRIHTSTVSVIVLPQPEEVEVDLKEKDLKIETKRSSGAGGQHVNTTDSAVRITHIPSGIVVESQVDRSQIKNRQHALQRLRAKLYQLRLDEQLAQANATRKMQVKSNLRSEKIRTYNFSQDRITDHRLSNNMHNMESFMSGEELLDKLIQQLEIHSCKERLQQKIDEDTST
ncbi:peptide chain release factor 1-like, mitochondrial [Anabrus simplex]|uniref:peptide chain release factor 1-like, mitochondrial n=1 Tax=Anabrus simplex TaxID=316456 RepID=UPI0035A35C72